MNKRFFLAPLAAFFLLISSDLFAQTSWEKIFIKKNTDVFRSVAEATAGGYILAGYTADSTVNDTDAYVVRMNTSGDTLWTKTLNGTSSRKDLFYKVINTADGGFAFCGYSTSYGAGSDDSYWVKMDGNGNVLWTKTLGGIGKDRAQEIIQTADGGYAITGYTTSAPAQYYDAFIIRTNSAGDTLWTRRYGSSGYDDANSIRELPDGGFIIGGQSTNGGTGLDLYLVRTNSAGTALWTNRWGTAGTDNIEHIVRNSDGTFILGGGTDDLSGLGGNDGYIVKTDTGGTQIWAKIYGGTDQDDFHRIEATTDGGFIASGTSRSSGPLEPNMWLMKTDANGDSTWSRTLGGTNHDHGYSGMQTSDGGYIMAGYSSSFGFAGENAYVVKLNGSGNLGNYLTYGTIYGIIAPAINSCGNATQTVKVTVRNFGRDTISNIPVTINITGAVTQTLNQTYLGAIHPDDFDTLTFTTTINTLAGGTLNFSCSANVTNDVYPASNTLVTSVTIIPFSSAPSVTNGLSCGPGTVNLSATSPDSVFWYNAPTAGTLLATGSSYTTPSLSTTTTYYAQAGGTCPSSRVAVTATIGTVPAVPTTTSAQRCGTGTVILTASSADPISWYAASTGGASLGSGVSFTTPSISSTTTYYAEANNGTCASTRAAATATILPAPANPVTTGASRCGTGTVQLSATSSNTVNWYDVSSGGVALGTGLTFTTPSISSTTTYYAEATDGTCPSNRIPAVATVGTTTPDPVVSSAARCGAGSVTLGASSSATIIWYPTSSGGTQLGTGSTFMTPFITTTTTYYAQATNGVCPSNFVPVQAIINPIPSISLGPDSIFVLTSTVLDPGPGFVGYSWTTSATTQAITVSITGNYCVTVTANTNCTATDCIYVDVSVGINEQNLNPSAEIFPNPTTGTFSINYSTLLSSVKYQVFNSTGQVVTMGSMEMILPGSNQTIDLSEHADGVYLLRIESMEGIISKFVLKH